MKTFVFIFALCAVLLPTTARAAETNTPIVTIRTTSSGMSPADRGPRIVAALWNDGRVVWSESPVRGGPPYRQGRFELGKLNALLARLASQGAFTNASLTRAWFGPDSSFTTITIADGARRLTLRSWHELYEGTNTVATSFGLEPLAGRNRDEVLRSQPVFYEVGVRLEIERIAHWARALGLGAPTGIDLPYEAPGLIPDPEWKERTQKVRWYAGETVSVAIGQGQVTVTPVQMARVAAFLATGRLPVPHLVKAKGGVPVPIPAPVQVAVRPETLATIRAGMRAVVSEQGTGWRARIPGISICGKTGSAQVVAHTVLARHTGTAALLPHGWFIAFAPEEKPRIAIAVLVEHGGSGGEAAAPVAHEILSRFFDKTPMGPAVAGVVDTEQ